jgi:hypothetical protein
MGASVETHRLERNAVGLAPTLFQSITHMAPAAAVAFSIIVGAPYAGGSLPLAVLLALVACLLVAVSIGQLGRHLPSAGGLYTYSSRGLHPYVGFLVARGFILADILTNLSNLVYYVREQRGEFNILESRHRGLVPALQSGPTDHRRVDGRGARLARLLRHQQTRPDRTNWARFSRRGAGSPKLVFAA